MFKSTITIVKWSDQLYNYLVKVAQRRGTWRRFLIIKSQMKLLTS